MSNPLQEEADESPGSPSFKEWEAAKRAIYTFWIVQNLTLPEVMGNMQSRGFLASDKMYKDKFSVWKWGKNASRSDWLFFAKLCYQSYTPDTREPLIKMYNKIRRMQDLKRYLKSHGQDSNAFFDEGIAIQTEIPVHIHLCDAQGNHLPESDNGGLSLPQEYIPDRMPPLEGSLPHLAPSRPPDQDSSVHWPKTPPGDVYRGILIEDTSSQDTDPWIELSMHNPPGPEDVHDLPDVTPRMDAANNESISCSQTNSKRKFQPIGDISPTSQSTLAHSNRLDKSRAILEVNDNSNEIAESVYSVELDGHGTTSKDCPGMPVYTSQARQVKSGPPEANLRPNEIHLSYISACMMACMLGAARKTAHMYECLRRASVAFLHMCKFQSRFVLTAASTMLTLITLQAERDLARQIMQSSLETATIVLGPDNPICTLLQWMLATTANRQFADPTGTARLYQIWQGFDQSLGSDHGHTIIALYCLSFNLMAADKQYDVAEQYLKSLLTVSIRAFGLSNIQTINILAALSRAQSRQGKYDDALETIDKALTAAPLGPDHPHRLELFVRKAVILRKLGRTRETEDLYWHVVRGRVATLGMRHEKTTVAHDSLVHVLKENGTWETKKDAAQRILTDMDTSRDEYVSKWRRFADAHRKRGHDEISSEEEE